MKSNSQDYLDAITYLKKYIKEYNKDDTYYQKCLKELKTGRPIQYIIGNVNFYGLMLYVDESVLIPRFETELLVDKTIQKINQSFPNQKINILDLGTGSGCIAIALKKNTLSQVDALDISQESLEVAKKNALTNSVKINFIKADMCTYRIQRYDVIISNPPYIQKKESIMDIVKNYEPHLALYAKDKGLYYYRQIIKNLSYITKEKYLVCFEIGEKQSKDIKLLIQKTLPQAIISIEKDYHNKERFIFITNINN